MQINTLDMTMERDGRWIRLVGDVNYATTEQVRAALAEPTQASGGSVVLDLRDVSFMSSMGLELLLELERRQAPGRLILLLNPMVEELFDVTGLRGRFSIAGSETEADHLLTPAA
jgi:anti-anti-sigma factor